MFPLGPRIGLGNGTEIKCPGNTLVFSIGQDIFSRHVKADIITSVFCLLVQLTFQRKYLRINTDDSV